MQTLVIAIGRNFANTRTPMGIDDWEDFKSDLTKVIETLPIPNYSDITEGIGSYGGVAEETSKTTLSWKDTPKDFEESVLPALRVKLALLAHHYVQESIALTVGSTEFVER